VKAMVIANCRLPFGSVITNQAALNSAITEERIAKIQLTNRQSALGNN